MTMHRFNLEKVHSSWRPIIEEALALMDQHYLKELLNNDNWLPGPDAIFNAFSLPLHKVNYVLFGESPYPRAASANGYAFWDAAVDQLWSQKGMSKEVNRATSLRNFIKMLFVAANKLDAENTNQESIASLNKQGLIQTNQELFQALLDHGFLLLNATPVLQEGPPKKDARAFQPFTQHILEALLKARPNCTLLFFGRIAQALSSDVLKNHKNQIHAEHPYNITFINNSKILHFFQPLHLLSLHKKDKVEEVMP